MTIKLVALILLCLMTGTAVAQEPKVTSLMSKGLPENHSRASRVSHHAPANARAQRRAAEQHHPPTPRPRVNRRDLRGDRAPPRFYRLSAPKPSQTRAWRRFEHFSPYDGVRPQII